MEDKVYNHFAVARIEDKKAQQAQTGAGIPYISFDRVCRKTRTKEEKRNPTKLPNAG
jgi:hypothetical protein